MASADKTTSRSEGEQTPAAPSISLPKGGGAIHGIGEKFGANPVTGTGSTTVPLATSPGRSGFGPQLSLAYDSGAGNGPFGFGWNLSLPSITRKTDKGLPQYDDAAESDVFILSGAEDLVPVLVDTDGTWRRKSFDSPPTEPGYTIQPYRPRVEGLFARIERWTEKQTGISHWRSISKDNITTLYGKREDARIADPADPSHIFSWLICESYDDKGNAVVYEYKSEDDKNVDHSAPEEQNRLINSQFAQRYVKRIKYGNQKPNRDDTWNATDPAQLSDWSFEVVFDYGEHDLTAPTTNETQPWPVRQDPVSFYRATFETRTYRLCRRVLMFHHFTAELGTADCLVRSTDFDYIESPIASFITSVTQSGYVRQPDGTYLKKSLPKLEFQYTEARVDETVQEIDRDSIENLPYGADGSHYQWVDLDSEGLSGVLTEQADAWFYKRNLGNGSFGPVELVARRPSLAALSGGRQQLIDLAGDGSLDLVQFDASLPGFYERTLEEDWADFTPFETIPNVDWKDPNLRFVDLTGDGHADILISQDTVFTWYPSRAEQGFGPAERTAQAWDEEKGPKLIFADGTQSVFLADMSGDGLTDLARIRNGEVCYWPNLGYGRFGAKVTMGNAPVFDYFDLFDQKRIRVADIDGSGNTDLIYLGQNEIFLYFNQSGNSWSAPQRLTHFPRIDDLKFVTAVDLLGNGTACLVWSSPLSSDARQPMRYIDLMGGQKPHLLVAMNNNMGAQTEVQYAASTRFYLQDRAEGRPWVTRLPFPVHVVERTESRDLVSNTKLVSTYRYRHGYFDGVEREFRGFAHVEQRDAETVSGQFDLPAVVTKTWFHTGAYLEGDKLEAYFKDPDNHEYFTGDDQAMFLPDTELPPNLSADESREACRVLKGSILRQEVYADDGTEKAQLPYSVSERSYSLRLLQPRGPNQHTVFFSHASEAIDYHYERNPADPRITHALTLEVDAFGNVTKSAAVGYGRRGTDPDLKPEDQAKQTQRLITYTEAAFINKPDETDWYRIGVPVEMLTFEITGSKKPTAAVFSLAELSTAAQNAPEIPYEQTADGSPQKRPIEHVRTLYRKDDLSGFLPAGHVESMALPGESYKLSFTPGLLDVFQTKVSRADVTALLTGAEGRYRDLDSNGSLWIPSGLIFFSPSSGDPQELAFARDHFFLPHRFQDPFGNNAVVTYDDPYKLLVESTRDALDNLVQASNDYRVLQPRLITDPNGNRAEVRFDALGMVAGTAVMGKAAGPVEGDSFDTFTADLTAQQIKDFFDAPNPRSLAVNHLGSATTRIIYDLEHVPVCAAAIARETHAGDLAQGEPTKVQLHFGYTDGFGREAQTKVQAEPGPLDPGVPNAPILDPRWVGTGTKVYNNKGKPVRQYEPFFSPTHQFGVEQQGVSSTLFYDPVERVVATLHPNHTWGKVLFDPWRQESWDVSDNVLIADPKADLDVGDFFQRLADAEYLPTWYAQRQGGALGPQEQAAASKAAIHAATPTVAHADSLGRTFLTVAHNKFTRRKSDNTLEIVEEPPYRTRVIFDIEGNQRAVIDAKDRVVMGYDYDMLGTRIHQASMEAGERWMLADVAGKPIYAWDSRDHQFRTAYDPLRRPTDSFLREGAGQELLIGRAVYGEIRPNPEAKNLRGKVVQLFDQAGVVSSEDYDFKGNLLSGQRQLATEYKVTLDWLVPADVLLEPEVYTSRTRYDALNRPTELTTPHTPAMPPSIIHPGYNEANLLERVEANLRGAQQNGQPDWTPFVTNIDYDAKGQRTLIDYGNGVRTTYEYDPLTFRLVHLLTRRNASNFPDDCPQPPPTDWPGCQVQSLHYTYDPVGNITHIRDDAQQTIYFRKKRVEPSAEYTYDAIYRLIEATGREHLGQVGGAPIPHSYNDVPRVGINWSANDGKAMGTYVEQYVYDAVGNFKAMRHIGSDPTNPGWTRAYTYNEDSLLELGKQSNRLTSTTIGAITETYSAAEDGYDAHGNMLRMPQLQIMQWDFRDQLQMTQRQAVNADDEDGLQRQGERTYYVYDASGQRVRKVTERQNGTRKQERIYLGGFEIYREYNGSGATGTLERETLHIMDDKQRIALVEIRIQGVDDSLPQLIRYQFGNHLGSASLELDDQAQIISYEEYTPYGSTSYQAVRNQTETPKRYRYTGKERDEESGFYYHGARYYAPWIGRWIATDPAGLVDGDNLYRYSRNNPIRFNDPNGMDPPETPSHSEYRLPAANPLTDPLAQASYFDLLPGFFGWTSGKLDLGNRTSSRFGEFAATGLLFYGPEVLSHEFGGHVGAAQRFGGSGQLDYFNWFSANVKWSGGSTAAHARTIQAAGVNQQLLNSGTTYTRIARSGYFNPQDAWAYFLGQAGTGAYALKTLSLGKPPSNDDINNYTGGNRGSQRGIAAAATLTALPSLVALGWIGYEFTFKNRRTLEVPSLHIGSASLAFPHLQTLLTSQGVVLGASTVLNLGRDRPAFQFGLDVRPSSDFALAVGARAYGTRIPGVQGLQLNPYIRATFASHVGISGGVEANFDISPRLGISGSIGGRTNDLLGETEGRTGGFEAGGGAILRF